MRTSARVLSLTLAIVAIGGAAPTFVLAQEGDNDATESDTEQLEPIATAQIGPSIEDTFHELQALTPNLRRQRDVVSIRDRLPAYSAQVEELLEDPALERLDDFRPGALHDLELEWARVRSRLLDWQAVLDTRVDGLSEYRTATARSRDLWEITLVAERDEPLPASQRERIDALVARIERVLGRLDLRLREVLELQAQLSDLGLRIASTVARIASAQQRARERRESPDHRPLWRGGAPLREAPPGRDEAVVSEHNESVRVFWDADRDRFQWQLIGFVVLFGLLLIFRFRHGPARPKRFPSAVRALRGRPLGTAVLLTASFTAVIYPYLPEAVLAMAVGLSVLALLRLTRYLLPARPPILVLLCVSLISLPLELGYVPTEWRRLPLLALQLIALASIALLSWPRFGREIALSDRRRRAIFALLRVGGVMLAIGLFYNVSGYVERAEVLSYGTFYAAVHLLSLFVSVELARAALQVLLRHRWAQISLMVRNRRRQVVRVAVLALRWGALALFLYLTLTTYDYLDPFMVGLRRILREGYTFGSLEVSLGELLAFLAVIGVTIALVRLVHFVLNQELLPRLNLDQGARSAVSLTVSYILVAIGVVLAFGTAGVNPEQLALLGGALGVGIGFGLQNIVSNFVSGLILVAERPIKVGDVIEVGDLVGEVKRIGIRSSTVRSLDGADVIVPNSDLISDQLVNWTLNDARRRIELVVGVGYQHAPSEVAPILKEIVRTQPGVHSQPPPTVLCKEFGASSIDFSILIWTTGFVEALKVRSELAQRIYDRLAAEGIEIPFPQQDLHLRSVSDEVRETLGQS